MSAFHSRHQIQLSAMKDDGCSEITRAALRTALRSLKLGFYLKNPHIESHAGTESAAHDRRDFTNEEYEGKQERIISDEMWQRVQAILRSDSPIKDHKGKRETLAPLKGLLYCGHCGCRMGPTYAKKDDVRYTYYLCTKDSKRGESICPVSRVTGGEIESAVLVHLRKILCTPTIVNQLAQALKKPGKEVSGYLDRLTPLWDEMFPAERNRVMHLLLQKVTLYEDRLELEIRTAGMKQLLEELDYERKN